LVQDVGVVGWVGGMPGLSVASDQEELIIGTERQVLLPVLSMRGVGAVVDVLKT